MDLIVDALATFRLARLVTTDTFPPVQRARDRVLDAHPSDAWGELVECPWCISFWIAAGVVAVRTFLPSQWRPIARVLAFSAAAGLLAERTQS